MTRLATNRSQPQAHIKLQSKNFFDLAHGQSPRWQADPPFPGGGCLPLCCPAPFSLWKPFRRSRTQLRDRPETVRLHPGTGVHLHPGILFGINPEHRSESSRNRVHLAPDSPSIVKSGASSTSFRCRSCDSSKAWQHHRSLDILCLQATQERGRPPSQGCLPISTEHYRFVETILRRPAALDRSLRRATGARSGWFGDCVL